MEYSKDIHFLSFFFFFCIGLIPFRIEFKNSDYELKFLPKIKHSMDN